MSRHALKQLCFAAVLTLAAAACGEGGSDPAGPSPSPSNGTISLTNQANVPIVEVNITACSDDSWGPNRLDAGQTIAPGGSRTWSLTPGCYDVRAKTASKAGSWWDKMISSGNTVYLALSSAANELAVSTLKSR